MIHAPTKARGGSLRAGLAAASAVVAAILALAPLSAVAAPPGEEGESPANVLARARALARAGDGAGAESLLEALVARDGEQAEAWATLGYLRHARGDLDGALAAHEKAAGFPSTAATAAYNAACVHSLKGRADGAFAWLRKAHDAGFRNPGQLTRDGDLAGLRGDPRFAALLPTPAENGALFREKPRVLHVLYGESAGDRFGWVGGAAGDCDGDGVTDLVISAPTRPHGGPGAGRVYVHSGRTGAELFHVDGAPGDWLGNSVAGAGDVDGDGRADVLAGAPRPAGGAGSAVLLSGRDGRRLRRFTAGEAGDRFGERIAGAGDVDGDGVPDIAVSAPACDAAGPDAGRVYLYSGADGRLLWSLDGERAGDRFGSALAADGGAKASLLVVGAGKGGNGQRGRGYVFRPGPVRPAAPAFVIDGGASARALGNMFAGVPGDVDGDGVADAYVSDWEDDPAAAPRTGRVLVHSGADGRRLLELPGSAAGEGFGIGGGVAGDADGDGRADLVVGAWQSGEGATGGGRAAVFRGRDGVVLASWTCTVPGDTFGFDAAGVGDLDGDGGVDFLVTAAYSGVSGPNSGRAFVLAGPVPPPRAPTPADTPPPGPGK